MPQRQSSTSTQSAGRDEGEIPGPWAHDHQKRWRGKRRQRPASETLTNSNPNVARSVAMTAGGQRTCVAVAVHRWSWRQALQDERAEQWTKRQKWSPTMPRGVPPKRPATS